MEDLKDLPPDRWIFLDHPRYCCECSAEIEAGKKVLFFPFTNDIYCVKCSKVFTGKSPGGKPGREYMPPVGRE